LARNPDGGVITFDDLQHLFLDLCRWAGHCWTPVGAQTPSLVEKILAVWLRSHGYLKAPKPDKGLPKGHTLDPDEADRIT
jgi:hypothetical protein